MHQLFSLSTSSSGTIPNFSSVYMIFGLLHVAFTVPSVVVCLLWYIIVGREAARRY